MKHQLFTILLALCALAGTPNTAWAKTIKTYLFSGSQSGTTCQGYFYEEDNSEQHYTCNPSSWTDGTESISFILADGITVAFASSQKKIYVQNSNALSVDGDVTVTVGGGTQNYYIWSVELFTTNSDQSVITGSNWGSDVVENTHTFSETIGAGAFSKITITYSDQDIFLIDQSTTIIDGMDTRYQFTGSAICPEPTVVCNGRQLNKDTEYAVSYSDNDAPGTARVEFTGKSPFHGSVSKDYIIEVNTIQIPTGNNVKVRAEKDVVFPDIISVIGTGNLTFQIKEGKTLTALCGITIADGATLTVEWPGTLTVFNNIRGTTGEAGTSNIENGDGGDGGPGLPGVSGSLIVKSGTVNITGGQGGRGGVSCNSGKGGKGGKGGTGVLGSLTVNGGTVNINGGDGGDGGEGANSGNFGESGDKGIALSGTVTCTAANYVIQESSNKTTWSNLASGSTSEKPYVRVIETTPLVLQDNTDNASAIAEAAGDARLCTVTLDGRNLYKDGAWNTLCLPFDVDQFYGTHLDGATVMELDTDGKYTANGTLDNESGTLQTGLDANTGMLYLYFKSATSIKAGKPYIVKWETTGDAVENPIFYGVTIANAAPVDNIVSHDGAISFIGTYDSQSFDADNRSILFLGGNNTLYWPTEGTRIGACRAYFQLADGITAGDIANGARLFFGSTDTQGIISIDHSIFRPASPLDNEAGSWYTVSGVKVEKPMHKGLYIKNGRKVVR